MTFRTKDDTAQLPLQLGAATVCVCPGDAVGGTRELLGPAFKQQRLDHRFPLVPPFGLEFMLVVSHFGLWPPQQHLQVAG